jgi:hypothetical protein
MTAKNIYRVVILICCMFCPVIGQANTPQQILDKVIEQQSIERSFQEITMQVHSKSGQITEYKFELYFRRENDVLYSYTRFTHPLEVRNTQVVLIDNPNGIDTQLFYLPALRKTNQISGKLKSRPFMGSDFNFSDLEIYVSENDRHKIIEDTVRSWVIQTTSDEHPQYSMWNTTVDKELLIPIEVTYINKNSQIIKILTVDEYKQVGGKTIPIVTTMSSIKKGSKTTLRIDNIRIDIPPEEVPLTMFSSEYMEQR